jgi:2-keto-3-deoxy-6-phosphogluconate aldolase
VGVGSPLFPRERVERGEWEWVEEQCRAFKEEWKNCGKGTL